MDFGEVLSRAWKIIWKFKVLWIFGILSSCGQNSGGNGANSSIRFSGDDRFLPHGMQESLRNMEYFFDNILGWQIAAMVIGFLLFFLIVIFVFSAINAVGNIGLIQGTVKAEGGAETMSFGDIFNDVKPFFWRIFAFNLLAGIALMIIIVLLVLPLVFFGVLTAGLAVVCILPLICLLVPISWLVSILIEQVNIAIVVEDLDILSGLKRGWEVFRDNIGNMIIMGLILVIGGFIAGLIIALPMIAIAVPLAFGIIGGAVAESGFLFGSGIAATLTCLAIYLPVLIVLSGILQSYIKTAWTLTYLRITGFASPTPGSGEPILEGGV